MIPDPSGVTDAGGRTFTVTDTNDKAYTIRIDGVQIGTSSWTRDYADSLRFGFQDKE